MLSPACFAVCSLRGLLQSDAVEQEGAVSSGALLSTPGRGNLSRVLPAGSASLTARREVCVVSPMAVEWATVGAVESAKSR